LLQPFYSNRGKRIIKSPKIFFWDTGLLSYLTGINTENDFENGIMNGPLFENYIISEIIKKEIHKDTKKQFYFYRTSRGDEIDLIIDDIKTRLYIEIKSSFTFKTSFLKGIKSLKNKNEKGEFIYRGENISYSENIKIVNYKTFLEQE